MLQISFDLLSLNSAQKEALSGFIAAFPASEVVLENNTLDEPVTASMESLKEYVDPEDEPVTASMESLKEYVDPEDEDDAPSAEEAFGILTPTAAAEIPGKLSDNGPLPAHPAASMIDNNAVVAGSSTLDKNGLPWDDRIHASSHAKNADGTWRTKRGVDRGLLAEVEAQLKALMALPSPAPAARIETTAFPPQPPTDPALLAALAPPPPPAPGPVLVTPPPAVPLSTNAYFELLSIASSGVIGKKITEDEVTSTINLYGCPSLQLLANRLDLVPQVKDSLQALIATR